MDFYEAHEIYEYLQQLMEFLYSKVLSPDAYFILICVSIFAFLVIITGVFFYFTRLHYGKMIKQEHLKLGETQEEEKFKIKPTRNSSDKSQKKHSDMQQSFQSDKAEPRNKIGVKTGYMKSMGENIELESQRESKSLTVNDILTYLKSIKLNDVQKKQILDIILHKDAQQSFFEVTNECSQCIMKDQATVINATDCKHAKLKSLPEVQHCHMFQESESHLKTDELNANSKRNKFVANITVLEQCMNKLKRTHEIEIQKWKQRKAALLQKIEFSDGCEKEEELAYKLLSYKLEKVHRFCLSLLDDQSDLNQRYEKLLSDYTISENSKKELQTKLNQWKRDQAVVIENLKMKIIHLEQSNAEYNERWKKLKAQCESKETSLKNAEKQSSHGLENMQNVHYLISEIAKGKQTLSCMFPDIKLNDGLDCSEWFFQFGENILKKINKITEAMDTKVHEDRNLLDLVLLDMGGKIEDLFQEKKYLEDQVQCQKQIIMETDSLIGEIRQKIHSEESLQAEKLLSLEESLLKIIELCEINYKKHVNEQVTPSTIYPLLFDELLITRLNNALSEIMSLKGASVMIDTSKLPIHVRMGTHFEEQQVSCHNEFIQSASPRPRCREEGKMLCDKNESMQPIPVVTCPQEVQLPFNPNEVDPLPKSEKRKRNKKKRQDKK